jgi:hypothetical protein
MINALGCRPFDKLRANGLIQRFPNHIGVLLNLFGRRLVLYRIETNVAEGRANDHATHKI